MGLFDALTTAVGGLQAQSFALQNISGNISNSQTTGFKETDTSFDALVSLAAAGQQTSGSVLAESTATNSVQGSIESTTISTNMAINGDGWFVVAKPASFSDNQPVFDGVSDYTRRGDFQENQGGFLVNGAGYYLMGIPVSPTTGNPLGSVPSVLQFSTNFVPAQPTTQIQYKANLASNPTTASSSPTIPGSNLLNPVGFTANPLVGAPAAAAITGAGATLLPDAAAAGTGSQDLSPLGAATTMASLGMSVGQQITVFDGTSTTTYTMAAGDKISNLVTAIGAGAAQVTATVTGNRLVLTSASAVIPITVGGAGAGAVGFRFRPRRLSADQSAHPEYRCGRSDAHHLDRYAPWRPGGLDRQLWPGPGRRLLRSCKRPCRASAISPTSQSVPAETSPSRPRTRPIRSRSAAARVPRDSASRTCWRCPPTER